MVAMGGVRALDGRPALLQAAPPDAAGRSVLLARIDPPTFDDLVFSSALFVDMETGLPVVWVRPFGVAPTQVVRREGWWIEGPVPAGRYFLRFADLDASGTSRAGPLDLTIRVPEGAPPTLYVGTFHVDCRPPVRTGARPDCTLARAPVDESAAARAMVARLSPALAAPGTALARPYPPRLAGLPSPQAPEIRIDARSMAAALRPVPSNSPAPSGGVLAPRSEAGPPAYVSVSGRGGFIAAGGAVGSAVGAVAGPVVVVGGGVGALAVVAIVLVPIAAIINEFAGAPERERRAAAERAAAEARERLAPCLGRAAEVLAPAELERTLGAAVARASAPRPLRAAASPAWQATVTRVLLRSCAGPVESAGVEVATRWTAPVAQPGEDAAEVHYNRGVVGALPHPALAFIFRPYWELPLRDAACRPITDFCGPAGETLLLQEVASGVTGARDAIAAGR